MQDALALHDQAHGEGLQQVPGPVRVLADCVVEQVESLRKLLEARRRLAELKSKVVTNDRLESLLQRIIHDSDQLARLGRETGHGEAPATASPEEPQA